MTPNWWGGGENLLGECAFPEAMHAIFWVAHAHRGECVSVVAGPPGEEFCSFRVALSFGGLQCHFDGDLH